MARIFSIIAGFLFAVASLNAAAQMPRTFPRSVPQPGTQSNQPYPQQNQVNPQQQANPQQNQVNPQQANPQQQPRSAPFTPATPPTAPLKSAANADPGPANGPATPVTPPVVNYRDGLLTVQATNSTLGAVLNAIRNKTGIEFEGLEGGAEHVALSAGPAPAGDVLSTILQGSKFSFVAIGRADNPTIVQRVILTPKGAPGAVAGAAPQQPQPRPNDNGEGGGDEDNPDEQVNAEPQDTAAQPPQVQQPQPQEQPQQQNQQPQNQQPKTPEQLFQELQQMKQQQMQQEGATPPNPSSVPRKPPR